MGGKSIADYRSRIDRAYWNFKLYQDKGPYYSLLFKSLALFTIYLLAISKMIATIMTVNQAFFAYFTGNISYLIEVSERQLMLFFTAYLFQFFFERK